jgi:ABC-type glycerol-3-phosphate transport system substrate-binding protein
MRLNSVRFRAADANHYLAVRVLRSGSDRLPVPLILSAREVPNVRKVSKGMRVAATSSAKRPTRTRIRFALLAAVAAALAACGSSSTPAPASQAAASQAAASQAASSQAAGPITISGIVWGDWTFVQAAGDAFTKSHPNVTFKINAIPDGTYFVKIPGLFASADTPDFSTIPQDESNYPTYVKAGILANLNDVWASSGLNDKALPGLKATYTYSDGNTYTIAAGGTAVPLVYYNKDVFKAAGIADPATTGMTMDQFNQIVDKLKAANVAPVTAGLVEIRSSFRFFAPYFENGCGQSWISSVTKGDATAWKDPCIEAGLNVVAALKSKGVFAGGAGVTTTSDAIAQSTFVSGKAAMYLSGSYSASAIRKAGPNLNTGWFLLPTATSTPMSPVLSTVDAFGVSANSKNVATAKEFLAFMAAYDGMWQHGIVPRTDIPATSDADPVTAEVAQLMAASSTVYPDLNQTTPANFMTVVNDAINGVIAGSLTPAAAAQVIAGAPVQ